MIQLLAQTAPTIIIQEPEWKFWVIVAIGVLTLLTPIFMPFILNGIRSINARLTRGDEKFDDHAQKLAVLTTNMQNVATDIRDQSGEIKELVKTGNDNTLEERGLVENFRREVEREFAKKKEVEQLSNRMDDQHRETMRAIKEIGREQ